MRRDEGRRDVNSIMRFYLLRTKIASSHGRPLQFTPVQSPPVHKLVSRV